MTSTQYVFSAIRIPCAECNRHFRNQAYFVNKHRTSNEKSICERRRSCATCGAFVMRGNHKCNKQYCEICKQKRDVGHLCYMRSLKGVLPANADNILYVFYNFETTQNKRYSDTAKAHVPNLMCEQQFCAMCEDMEDGVDCERCYRRRHSFRADFVGDLLTYNCEPRPWDNKIVAIAHNVKAFDLHFILNRPIMLKWKPELITNGLIFISMKMEHNIYCTTCTSSREHCVNCRRLSVCRPLNHCTPTTLIMRKTSIMLARCPTYRIMLWTR